MGYDGMYMGKNVRIASIAAIIVAGAILVYGFIDAQSYRAGYVSGYSMMTRVLDVACAKGDVLDAELCLKTELALYGDESVGDGIYAAQAVDAILGTPAVRTSRWRSRRSSVQAVAPVAQPVSEPVPAPVVVEAPRPPTLGEIAQSTNCETSANSIVTCGKGNLEPFCRWSTNAAGVTGCHKTAYALSLGGDTEGICAKRSIKDRLTAAYRYVGTDPSTGREVEVCIGINGRFGYTMAGDLLDVVSWSEMLRVPALRTKGQALGAAPVVIQASVSLPPCPMMPPGGGPMPPMPPGGCTPQMMPPPGGQPPYQPPR